MKRKGFTLIELLAVIVILAVIALITVPIILNTVEKARKKAAEDSMYGYVKAVELAYVEKGIEGEKVYAGKVYNTLSNKEITVGETTLPIAVNGIEPNQNANNTLQLAQSGKVDMAKIKFGAYYVYYNGERATVEESENEDLEESTTLYKDPILNSADPILGENMIPVTLDSAGNVQYTSLYTNWYNYQEKKWANAVILVENPSKNYKKGDRILESDIESYFVWIPRFKYKIWNIGNYTSTYRLSQLTDTTTNLDTSIYHINGKARLIDIVFENKEQPISSGNIVGNYITHPAFSKLDVNGLWVGKFEVGYNQNTNTNTPINNITNWTASNAEKDEINRNKIIIKPNVYSWRNTTVYNMFMTSYQYNRNLDSHMIKNTEWGAIAYLSHSVYGIGKKININNNSNYLTGYSTASNVDQSSYQGVTGTSADITKGYNTLDGYFASTTGNITGIYDMSGGANELVAAYKDGYGVLSSESIASGFSNEDLTTYAKYLDKYTSQGNSYSYSNRILGDATGELGPFYEYYEKDGILRSHNSWYSDYSYMTHMKNPWVLRGGINYGGKVCGQFYFSNYNSAKNNGIGFRIALAVK